MSSARPDTWMPFYWGDYLRDTGHLSPAEHGVYVLIIGHYWTHGGALADDEERLARVARMTVKEWRAIRGTLSEFFTVKDGQWHHKRIDHELAKATRVSRARQKAGKRGGKASANARAKGQANDEANDEQKAGKRGGKASANDEAKGQANDEAKEGFCYQQNPTQSQPPSKIPSQEVTEVSEGLSGRGAAGR